ncbi:anthrone oxygenase family protein [Hylemonella gracilis]|nr:anthrone oxygenase family protein [Hylemonella gracilis]
MTTASVIASALVGGVFFAFSVFVMRALASMPPAQGILAMQRINIAVIHPLFLGVFLGTAPLLAVSTYLARSKPHADPWLLAAFLVYGVGSVVVTLAFNVPRNNRLAALGAATSEAEAYWPVYLREWLFWNHVRCIASITAAVLAMRATEIV